MEQTLQKNRKKIRQDKYRRIQQEKGLQRLELQVRAETKARFETMVEAIADEMIHPTDPRQKQAKARAQVFDELTQAIHHEFFVLKDQIKALKEEISALSPDLSTSQVAHEMQIPQAVHDLPEDPQKLKQLIAYFYQQSLNANRRAKNYKQDADRYLRLYEVASRSNDKS